MTIERLKSQLNVMRDEYSQRKGKRDTLLSATQAKSVRLEEIENGLAVLNQVNALLQKTSEFQRKTACKQIEDLGTYALQFIFGKNYRLSIELKEAKSKPEAEIYVITMEDGREVKNIPQDDRGGGVVDIVSLALKIVSLQAYRPQIDGPIILDEPGKHVSSEHIEPLANFLKEIGERFNRQIIIITHNEYLAEVADRKLTVNMIGGISKVK